jgi:hypothetical protein
VRDVLDRIHAAGWRGIKMWDPRVPEPLTWLYEAVLGFAGDTLRALLKQAAP